MGEGLMWTSQWIFWFNTSWHFLVHLPQILTQPTANIFRSKNLIWSSGRRNDDDDDDD